ncbi:BAG domain [Dillenia turbinata]|uniref:BAG domain n=1 Tax=Dillenia turbinata TaxID=194707 RepID=A0AAN8Z2T9_9MAGN
MESPFFRTSHWSTPSRRSIPVHQTPVMKSPAPARKVVTIPVQYVSSDLEKRKRESSALKIQKVFREFMVRKSMKKIASINAEVEEIGMRISKAENLDLIRRDSKERLMLNEMIMSLLFKLDSVRGVDSGIRVRRKGVIKKAIALQEKLDSLVAGDQMVETGDQSSEANDLVDSDDPIVEQAQTLETQEQASGDSICADNAANQSAEMQIHAQDSIDQTLALDRTEQTLEFEAAEEILEEEDPKRSKSSEGLQIQDENDENRSAMCSTCKCEEDEQSLSESEKAECASGKQEEEQMIEKNGKSEEAEGRVREENKRNKDSIDQTLAMDRTQQTLEFEAAEESLEEDPKRSKSGEELQIQDENGENRGAMCSMCACEEDEQSLFESKEADCASGKQEEERTIEKNRKSEEAERRVREESKKNGELLEKMVEDNAKMIGLMAELYERNEMQTLLLSSLTQRVEQLERALRLMRLYLLSDGLYVSSRVNEDFFIINLMSDRMARRAVVQRVQKASLKEESTIPDGCYLGCDSDVTLFGWWMSLVNQGGDSDFRLGGGDGEPAELRNTKFRGVKFRMAHAKAL